MEMLKESERTCILCERHEYSVQGIGAEYPFMRLTAGNGVIPNKNEAGERVL